MQSPGVVRWYRGPEAPSCWPCSSRGPAIQLLAPQKALVVPFAREGRGSEKERVPREEEDEEEENQEAALREEEEEEVEVEDRRESPNTLVGRTVGSVGRSVGVCVS